MILIFLLRKRNLLSRKNKDENDDKINNKKENKTFDYVSKAPTKEEKNKSPNINGSQLSAIRPKNEDENKKLINFAPKQVEKVSEESSVSISDEKPKIQIKRLELPSRTQDQDSQIANTKSDAKLQNYSKSIAKIDINQNSENRIFNRSKLEENSDPEVTPSNERFLEVSDDTRGYMTQRNHPEQRMVPNLKAESKDDSQPLKPRGMYGLPKKSVQVSDTKLLNQTLGMIKKKSKPKLKAKQNISMVENYELKDEKLVGDKELKFSRPISTLKAISQASFQMAKKSPYSKGKYAYSSNRVKKRSPRGKSKN